MLFKTISFLSEKINRNKRFSLSRRVREKTRHEVHP